jgi:hypothetical protein
MKGAISLVQAVLIIVILLALGLIISTFIRGVPLAPFGGCGHESQKCCGNEFSPLGFCLDPGTQCIEYDNEKLCLKPATELSIDKEALVWSDANFGEFISNYPTNNFYMTTQGIGKESLDHLNENCWVEGQDARFGGCNNCSLTSNINSLLRQNTGTEPPNFIEECSDCDQCNASEKTCRFCVSCKSFNDTAIFYKNYFKTFAFYENLTNCANCSDCTVDEYGFGTCNNCTFCESGDVVKKDEFVETSSECHFCSRYDGSKYYNCYFCTYLEDKSVATPTDDYYACDVCEKVDKGTLKCSDNSSYLLCEDMKAALGNNMSTPVPLAENIPVDKGQLDSSMYLGKPSLPSILRDISEKCDGQPVFSDLSFGFRKNIGTFKKMNDYKIGAYYDYDPSEHCLTPALERATNFWSCGVTDQPNSIVYQVRPGYTSVGGEFFSLGSDMHFYNIYYYAPNNTITICRQPALTTHEDDAILDIPLKIMKEINLLKLGGDFHIIEKDDRGLTYIHTNYHPIEVKLNYDARRVDLFNAIITGFNIWRVAYSDPFYLNVTYGKILGVKCTNETSCKNIDLSGELSNDKYGSNVLLWANVPVSITPSPWYAPNPANDNCICFSSGCICSNNNVPVKYSFGSEYFSTDAHISLNNMYRYIFYNPSDLVDDSYKSGSTIYIKVDFLVVWKNETQTENKNGVAEVEFIPIVFVSKDKGFVRGTLDIVYPTRKTDSGYYSDQAFNLLTDNTQASDVSRLDCYENKDAAEKICKCQFGSNSHLVGCTYGPCTGADAVHCSVDNTACPLKFCSNLDCGCQCGDHTSLLVYVYCSG